MYLNVIAPPVAPLPSVRGLGQVRLIAPPGRHRRGMGQGPAGAASCAQYIANAMAGLPSASEAAMLLNTGAPSGAVLSALYINGATSPQEAAEAFVQQLAQEYCGAVADEVSSGDPNAPAPPDCADGGASCAQAAYQMAYAFFSSLPASVWSTGMVSPQVANPQTYYAPAPAPPPAQSSQAPASAGGAGYTTPVQAAPVSTPAQTVPVTALQVNTTPINAPTTQTSTPAAPASSVGLPSWLTGDIGPLPIWGWALVAVGAFMFLPRGR